MKKLLVAALLCLLSRIALAAAPALDGTAAFAACGSGSPLVVSTHLTTTQTNDIVYAFIIFGATSARVNSITDTAGLTWHRRATLQASGISTDKQEVWYATSTGVLSSDTITATASAGGSCIKLMAIGISGAAFPVPFDPLYNQPTTKPGSGTQSFTTLGTSDFLLAFYQLQSCTPSAPTAGPGWTAIYNGVNDEVLVEYQQVSAAQTGLVATIGTCSGNTQSSIMDAFVSTAGLGSVEQSSKLNSYAILQTGMGTSKQNMYVIAEPGIGTSKLNSYVILNGQTNVINPRNGLTIFHAFPP